MLVLSRKKGEIIDIGGLVRLTVVDVRGDNVRLGVTAPKEIRIFRQELLEENHAVDSPAASEQFEIGGLVRLTVVDVRGDNVRLGITAPKEIRILRQELLEENHAVDNPAASEQFDTGKQYYVDFTPA